MLSPTANPPRVAGPTGLLSFQSAVGPSWGPVAVGEGVVVGWGEAVLGVAVVLGVGVTDVVVVLRLGAWLDVGAADVELAVGVAELGSGLEDEGMTTAAELLVAVDVPLVDPLGAVSPGAADPGSGDGVGVRETVGATVGGGSSAITDPP